MGLAYRVLALVFILGVLAILFLGGWQWLWVENLLMLPPLWWASMGLGLGMGLSIVGAAW
jgi:hypothetical protein